MPGFPFFLYAPAPSPFHPARGMARSAAVPLSGRRSTNSNPATLDGTPACRLPLPRGESGATGLRSQRPLAPIACPASVTDLLAGRAPRRSANLTILLAATALFVVAGCASAATTYNGFAMPAQCTDAFLAAINIPVVEVGQIPYGRGE